MTALNITFLNHETNYKYTILDSINIILYISAYISQNNPHE